MTERQELRKQINELNGRISSIDEKLHADVNSQQRQLLWVERNHLATKVYICKRKLKNLMNGKPANGYDDNYMKPAQ